MTENNPIITPKTRPQFLVGIFYLAFRAISGAYAMSILISLLIHLFIPESVSEIVAFTNSTLYFMMIGTLVLLPIFLFLHRWEIVAMLLPSVIAWVLWTVPAIMPKPAPQIPPDATSITILTYNLLANGRDHEGVIRIIDEANADVVVLQEFGTDVADTLTSQFLDEYPYREFYAGGIPGMGIMSRYPLEECSRFRVVFQHQRCLLRVDDQTVVLYNVHTMSPLTGRGFALRQQDIDAVLMLADADREAGETIIMAGDWNMTPLSDGYEQVTAHFSDAYAQIGQGIGFTYRLHNLGRFRFGEGIPVVRIDYVFYTAPLIAQEARVWHENAGSDHIPVWVKLALP
jgi:endonuclease/exonuclease/phosphatase (EEP) superfamily protein YafD